MFNTDNFISVDYKRINVCYCTRIFKENMGSTDSSPRFGMEPTVVRRFYHIQKRSGTKLVAAMVRYRSQIVQKSICSPQITELVGRGSQHPPQETHPPRPFRHLLTICPSLQKVLREPMQSHLHSHLPYRCQFSMNLLKSFIIIYKYVFTAVQEFLKSVKILQSNRQSSGPQFFFVGGGERSVLS